MQVNMRISVRRPEMKKRNYTTSLRSRSSTIVNLTLQETNMFLAKFKVLLLLDIRAFGNISVAKIS